MERSTSVVSVKFQYCLPISEIFEFNSGKVNEQTLFMHHPIGLSVFNTVILVNEFERRDRLIR